MREDRVPGEDPERTRRSVELLAHRARDVPEEDQPAAEDALADLRETLDDLRIQRELLDTTRRELETERQQLRELFHLAPDAYLVTDAEGVIQEANRTASALLGVEDGELVGRSLADFATGTGRATLQRRLRIVRQRENPAEWKMRLTPPGGDAVDVEATVAAAHEGDRLVGLRWLLRDVTERKRAELATRRLYEEQAARVHAQAAERRNAFLAGASEILAGSLDYATTLAGVARLAVPQVADSCIVYVVEEDGRVHRPGVAHADPDREETLRGILEGRPFDPASLSGPVARVLRTGETELIPEITIDDLEPLSADEDDAWDAADVAPRSLLVVPLRIRERVLGALSLGWDEPGKYTPDDLWRARKLADRAALAVENARLHREANRASEAKSEFLAAMSHEFRTPLTAILAFAELLVDGIPEPISGAPLRHAEQILGASKHLAHLIDQVLTLSRLDAEREKARSEPVDLGALARDTAALIGPLALQKELGFAVEAPEHGPTVHTDANKLRQVLFNLLGNAVKFTERGTVRLRVRTEGERTLVEVHDTGEGMTPEQLERIWEPFWQAGRPVAGRPPGTGLGLGIVRRLVRLLGGEIRVESAPGRGSVFTVELGAGRTER
ncbi:MAG TPA: ATP-binding protein [Longimicrobiaceae bacterium]|nr:ATP-binding protein [Longimicrobiaceae bacterium]